MNGWTDSKMQSNLDWAAGYYGTTVKSYPLDANGNRITDVSLQVGKEWEITFTL